MTFPGSYRSVGIEVSAKVFDLKFQLVLGPLVCTLTSNQSAMLVFQLFIPRLYTLKARCSRKCAVPFVLSVSALLPASIHTPTVEVWAYGECSVAI